MLSTPALDEMGRPLETTGIPRHPSDLQNDGNLPAPGSIDMPIPDIPVVAPQGTGGPSSPAMQGYGGMERPEQGSSSYTHQEPPPGVVVERQYPAATPQEPETAPTTSGGTNGSGGPLFGQGNPTNGTETTPSTEDDPPEEEEEEKDDNKGWQTAGLLLLWIAAVGGLLYLLPILIDYRRQHQTLLIEKAELEESLAHANRVMATTTASGRDLRDPPPREPREPARRREERTY